MRFLLPLGVLLLVACTQEPPGPERPVDAGIDAPVLDRGDAVVSTDPAPIIDRAPGCTSDAGCACAGGATGHLVCFWDGGYTCACPMTDAGPAPDMADVRACDVSACTCPDGRPGNYNSCVSEWCECTGPIDAGPVRRDGCGLDPDGACIVPGDVPPDTGVWPGIDVPVD